MTPDVQAQLAALNREFYETFAEAFAETRPRPAPGVQRVLDRIPAGSRVLEIGCGDGKAGRRLAARGVAYVGVDASAALIARAERYTRDWRLEIGDSIANLQSPISFLQADVLTSGWAVVLGAQSFDWILAFAVFHHLPGRQTRAELLRALAARLTSGGTVALSNWQFTRSARLRRRLRPWSELGLREADVEPNDYLLSWERGGRRGLRYVHLLDETEARSLAESAGLAVNEVFSADGVSNDLTEYVLMAKESRGLVAVRGELPGLGHPTTRQSDRAKNRPTDHSTSRPVDSGAGIIPATFHRHRSATWPNTSSSNCRMERPS